uniref:FHA domain-containing protein n=1 Tax=Elaeophora elaphi TaxID=1147741 RepID=A0A0R3RXM0_9BILA
MTIYQLRRLHVSQNSQSLLPDDTVLLYQTTKIGRNPDLVDVVLISHVHSNMISREHTTIFVKAKRDRYACFIKDHSLNGTYVNDFRVSGEAELQQGDVIKFGHVNGAAIKPGCYGPQTSAEFTFVFEEAPAHRLSDRRRPITIMGNARQDFSQMFVGDGKNLHAASRLPLTNPSMELATSWQTPAAAAAAGAAAAPFYNLQRFPGYYQAAFPQLSSAYLHSLWPQNPWPSQSPATAQQFQHHQLEQQKQVEAVTQYGQLTNSAWMGANAQIAADTSSFMGTANDNRLRAVPSEQASSPRVTSNITVQMATTATVAGACSQRSASTTSATVTDQSPGIVGQNISAQSNQLLQSLAQHTSASRSARAPVSAILSGNIPVTRSGTTATRQQHYSTNSRVVDAQRVSRLTDCSPAQVIATPSAIDSVKRMECDSSVPSPPKSQQQQQSTAAMFGVVPTGVGIHRTATTAVLSQPSSLSPITAIHAPTQLQAQVPTPIPPAAAAVPGSERKFSNDRILTTISTCSTFTVSSAVPTAISGMNVGAVTATPAGSVASISALPQVRLSPAATPVITQERPMEELQRENAERNSRLSGLEELTEDLLEDCGPPRRAPTPASSSSELPTGSTVHQESHTIEESKPSESLRSPHHQSPKRRGHGHSDSSCSPTQTPAIVEQKVEPKKRRKNNEVAMLLNDLTEVAWHHLARKSTNKITAPTQTRKVYANDEDDDSADNRSCRSDSSGSERHEKKKQQQKSVAKAKSVSSSKGVASSKARDSDRSAARKRGRPKKGSHTSESTITTNAMKKKAATKKKRKKQSSSSDSASSDSEGDKEERREDLKKPQTLPKDQPGTSAAEKIERALEMMRKRQQTLPDSDNESSSPSSFVSSSSPSPIRRTWGATSQRKTGHTPGGSGVSKKKMSKTGRQSRSTSKVPRKQTHKGIATSSTSIRKKGRKKKKRSSSSESEVSLETSSVDWEKMKPVVTPLPAAHAPMVFDEWTYHDPEKQCDARSGCKKPQSESVVWVQCDYCCRWYHMECVTEHGVTVGNSDDFNCGCREANKAS